MTRTAVGPKPAGLVVLGARVYVPVASYCDEPDLAGVAAEGRLVAVDADTAEIVGTFDPIEGYGNLGGMWGWGGVSSNVGRTTIYTGVGNSYVYSEECSCYVDDAGYGEDRADGGDGIGRANDDDVGCLDRLHDTRRGAGARRAVIVHAQDLDERFLAHKILLEREAPTRCPDHRPDWIVESACDLRVGGQWTVAFGPPGSVPA